MASNQPSIHPDPWSELKGLTRARIALGRVGSALPLAEVLQQKAAQAQARYAIKDRLDLSSIKAQLNHLNHDLIELRSLAADRETYLRRPDLGRRLDGKSADALMEHRIDPGPDIVFILADGLSAKAVEENAGEVIEAAQPSLIRAGWTIGPVVAVEGGRVAVADEVGQILNASLTAILIGERPGLTWPRSMSVYFTYHPRIGLTDERRNCISNIHPQGLAPARAANLLARLLQEARRLKMTGVELKDRSEHLIEPTPAAGAAAPR